MNLRDFFAAHVAAALAHRIERPESIAERAYDLAEALIRERGRRLEGAGEDVAYEDLFEPGADFFHRAEGLLDEPAPISENDEEIDPSLADLEFDPRWEAEPKWHAGQQELFADPPASDRPGLARTAPIDVQGQKRRHQA